MGGRGCKDTGNGGVDLTVPSFLPSSRPVLLRIVNPPATPTLSLGRLVGRARMLAELARHSFHAASTTLSAQQSVPWYAKESLFGARGLTILVTTLCLWMVDRMVLVPLKLKGRYFILHAAGNAIAVVLTWNGMVRTLLDPVHAAEGDVQIFGYCVVVAIHLYHVLAFRPLPQVEWVHISLYLTISPYVSLYLAAAGRVGAPRADDRRRRPRRLLLCARRHHRLLLFLPERPARWPSCPRAASLTLTLTLTLILTLTLSLSLSLALSLTLTLTLTLSLTLTLTLGAGRRHDQGP